MKETDGLQLLIESAQKGSHEDFRVVYERFVDRLFSYVFSHTKDRTKAVDVTQDTFVDLWQALGTFVYKSEEQFLGFLFIIVKRKLSAYYKKEKRHEKVEITSLNEISYEEHHEDYRNVITALENLSQSYQDVVRLRYWGDLSFSEIGKTMGIREEAARILHHRALKKLQNTMQQ